MKALFGVAALLSVSIAATASAQRPRADAQNSQMTATINNVVNCRSQTDDQARLRCFDAATAALEQASAAGSLLVVNKDDIKKARRGLFGFSLPKIPFLSEDELEEAEQVKELTTVIQKARGFGYGLWSLGLKEGGTWQTIIAQPDRPVPKVGQSVTIRRGPLGNYMMQIGNARGIRVKRVG